MSPRTVRHLAAAVWLLWLASGCAERLQLGHEAPGAFWTGRIFWPPGRYRTFLVCFSDLPVDPGGRPPVENEWTVMDGPDVPRRAAPPAKRSSSRYRLSLHAYEYESETASAQSRMLDEAHASESATATAARLGLASL